jgi:hypothetical protein
VDRRGIWPLIVVHPERRLVHPERAGDALLNSHVQAEAGDRLDHLAQPVDVDPVDERLTRIAQQRSAQRHPGQRYA